jgi:hypothetical protein
MGIVLVAPLATRARLAGGDDEVELQCEQLGDVRGEPLGPPLVTPPLDGDSLSLDIAEISQALSKGCL